MDCFFSGRCGRAQACGAPLVGGKRRGESTGFWGAGGILGPAGDLKKEEAMIHTRTCSICEALCGVEIEVEDGGITSIRGNPADPLSEGYLCPKGVALGDIHTDADRITAPLKRTGSGFTPISWDEALDETARRLFSVRERGGRRSVGVYAGNPNAHNYGTLLMGPLFHRALGSRSRFSATSADQLPHMFAALQMFGHQLLLPVPDIDRTDYALIMGANPLASNGSLMTAPNMRGRLRAVQERGGKVVVLDPRKTETAWKADAYYGVRPGTDAWFLLAFLHTILVEERGRGGPWESWTRGVEKMKAITAPYTPERVALRVGMKAEVIAGLAREFAQAPSAFLYGRVGVCTQRFGGLCAWLINVINIVTGNLDSPGGVMFTRPAVDFVAMTAAAGQTGHYDLWQSRVRGLPEFGGELPVSTLAEEIDTPGEGQIRGMVTLAGNPVLSAPNGRRLSAALKGLDFMVSLDMYQNETTGYAHIILPSVSPLERSHFGLVFHTLAVRNTVKYSPRLFTPPPGVKPDWEILLELSERLLALEGGVKNWGLGKSLGAFRRLGPDAVLAYALRTGPYGGGMNPFKKGLSLGQLKRAPSGVDLGPLRPCLPERLYTPDRKIELAPRVLLDDLARLDEAEAQDVRGAEEFLLIGRRHLRSNNSWLHNVPRLRGGSNRCTLMVHPEDGERLGLWEGASVEVTSRVGAVRVPVQLTTDMMKGVVSLPHGWGHGERGVQLQVASSHPGVSINDLTDEEHLDTLTGNAGFSGVPVSIKLL